MDSHEMLKNDELPVKVKVKPNGFNVVPATYSDH